MYYTVNFHGSCRNYPLKQMSKTPWSSVVSKYVILSRINCSGSVCQHSYVEKISRMRGGGAGPVLGIWYVSYVKRHIKCDGL